MFQIILSHWATYLFLAWALVILVANLWPRKKVDSPPPSGRYSAQKAEGIHSGIAQR
jgi:hypothetical protein